MNSNDSASSCSGGSISLGIELGFLNEIEEQWRMHRSYFPSKVGDKPAWLDPQNLPDVGDLKCNMCGKICIFLLQLYAPDESDAEAFHRTIYLFCCPSPVCYKANSNESLKVFRCQLRKENNFYPSEPPAYDDPSYFKTCKEFSTLCQLCGCQGSKVCSRCSSVRYCSKDHQVTDWKRHKLECGKQDIDAVMQASHTHNLLFPGKEIAIESYDELESNRPNATDDTECGHLVTSSGKSLSDKELEQFVNYEDQDGQFTKFRDQISNFPDQVIRYDKGGEPLWCSGKNILNPDTIPKCSCGSSRQFEFQVMPQLLNHLNIQSEIDGPSIDWGILAIYTCTKNCVTSDEAYLQEYIFKQDYS